jgi:hypothetical protein
VIRQALAKDSALSPVPMPTSRRLSPRAGELEGQPEQHIGGIAAEFAGELVTVQRILAMPADSIRVSHVTSGAGTPLRL